MLVELRVGEQRYRAVQEVLDGASVTAVARRFGVSRQSVHSWLNRYAADGGLGGLGDRSSRPSACPHQMSPMVEAPDCGDQVGASGVGCGPDLLPAAARQEL
jgi:transposase-like protein